LKVFVFVMVLFFLVSFLVKLKLFVIITQPIKFIHHNHNQILIQMSKVVDSISFFVNGVKHTLKSPSPHTTLAKFLRNLGLTGTKIVCSEGKFPKTHKKFQK